MFARITIQSGVAAGTSHFIKRRVARVGSDPKSEVCIPSADIPAHALTLEFKEDSCFVYNRCRESIYIGVQVVEPEQVTEWRETDLLQLAQDIELLLDFEDLETDAGFADYANDEISEPSDTRSESIEAASSNQRQSANRMKTTIQLGVIILCLMGCAFLLIRDQNRKSGPELGPRFTEIISTSIAEQDVAPELIQRLQYAEAQRVRGREKIANERYQSIRDDLITATKEKNGTSEKRNEQILRFVQSRLVP
ncbi:MAG: hypothetical protein AB8B55_19800 [Mariniblastus sp.]